MGLLSLPLTQTTELEKAKQENYFLPNRFSASGFNGLALEIGDYWPVGGGCEGMSDPVGGGPVGGGCEGRSDPVGGGPVGGGCDGRSDPVGGGPVGGGPVGVGGGPVGFGGQFQNGNPVGGGPVGGGGQTTAPRRQSTIAMVK